MDHLYKLYTDLEFVNFYKKYHAKAYPDLHIINGLPIHFSSNFERIGLSMSGGADSSLLFYILCKLIEETNSQCKIYPITMIRGYKSKPWDEVVQTNVYNWFKTRFPNIVQDHYKGFIPPDFELVPISRLNLSHLNVRYGSVADVTNTDVICTVDFLDYMHTKYKLDYVYSGTTTNPTEINNTGAPKFRNKENMKLNVHKVISKTEIDPFALITKEWIVAQYYNYQILDLFDLTRSCDSDANTIGKDTLLTPDVVPPPCGVCFFCKERQWAIDNKDKYLTEIQHEPPLLLRTRRNKLQEWIRNILPAAK